jgi:hypothetical protein
MRPNRTVTKTLKASHVSLRILMPRLKVVRPSTLCAQNRIIGGGHALPTLVRPLLVFGVDIGYAMPIGDDANKIPFCVHLDGQLATVSLYGGVRDLAGVSKATVHQCE